jgi:anti-anti-sigma factor
MPLDIRPTGAPRTFHLAGELDLLEADRMAATLEPHSRQAGDLILDVSDLDFIDSSGIRALLRTAENLGPLGHLVLRSPNRQVQVVMSLVGLAQPESGIVIEGGLEPQWGTDVDRRFPADRASLADIRSFVRRRAVEDSFGEWADAIVLAVSEASANSIVHSGAPQVEVVWRPYADHVEVEVRDEGVFKRALGSQSDETGNRGFLLMMSLMDQLSVTCGTDRAPGTAVRMVKYRNRGRPRTRSSSRDVRFLPSPQQVAS